jgi:cell division protein FtsI/penicillin-binding protein 2
MISRRGLFAGFSLAISPGGAGIVLRVSDGKALRVDNPGTARNTAAAPGSSIKPWLLEALRPWQRRPCTGRFRLDGRNLDCVHVPLDAPLDAETALAVSCNHWFAASALAAGARPVFRRLLQCGADAMEARTPEELQLQALGLERVAITPENLARAYRLLVLQRDATVRAGLRRAVTEGTARAAAIEGTEVAGKTGTSRDGAWFAGYAPASRPAVVAVVFQPAARGPSGAAPIAAELFLWAKRSGHL